MSYKMHKRIICWIIVLKEIYLRIRVSMFLKPVFPCSDTREASEFMFILFPCCSCSCIIDIMCYRNKSMHELILNIVITKYKVPMRFYFFCDSCNKIIELAQWTMMQANKYCNKFNRVIRNMIEIP